MELKQDLDYMLDIIPEIQKEGYSYSIDRLGLGFSDDWGIEIYSWAGDKGWCVGTDPFGDVLSTLNPPHVNILIPDSFLLIPPSSDIIAKFDISGEIPPQTEEEVKSLLFKVNEDLFLPEYCGMILKWANGVCEFFDGKTQSNWLWSRDYYIYTLNNLLQPKTEVLRKRCGLE